MKIVLIHGENTQESANRYSQILTGIKKKGFDIVDVDNNTMPLPELLLGSSLFETKNLYITKNIQKIPRADIDWLSKIDNSSNLLIYSSKLLNQTILKSLPKNIKIEKFDHPKLLFKFLDSFYPGNSKNILKILKNLLATESLELVFAMLARHLRDLYWSQEDIGPDYPDWRLSKLKFQSSQFKKGQLQIIISKLAEIDYLSKSSSLNPNIALDILIASHLK